MKKFILLTVASLLCIVVWTTVVFTLLHSPLASEELNEGDHQFVEYKPLLADEEEEQPQISVSNTSLQIENGITFQRAIELAPHQVISVDELLEIITENE
ncbi:hypothetical protein [Alkalihalobacterium chitinilyticum]|uniref:Uncharacterized protein n=1 Tax=Alkalihalobacterium chitinilyticum TaxID=2980103 RepID=A0ABT5VKD3_9BACI|nr:hypothetical protein [Alkalihalobacterium chitinilyticum]MDE5415896.1 hypothetical protein [Alkalihalobacterium chitinilyticum]